MAAWLIITIGAAIAASFGLHDWKTMTFASAAAALAVWLDRRGRAASKPTTSPKSA